MLSLHLFPFIPLVRVALPALLFLLAPTAAFSADHAVAPQGAFREAPKPLRWRIGKGPARATIVMLHGLEGGPRSQLFEQLSTALERHRGSYEVVAPWLRPVRIDGKGRALSDGFHTMSDQLKRVCSVIEEAPGPVILIGHSFGGLAAIQLSKMMPKKIACAVGLAPSIKMLYSYWKRVTGGEEKGLPADKRVLEDHFAKQIAGLNRAIQDAEENPLKQEKLTDHLRYLTTLKDLIPFDEPQMERGVRSPFLALQGNKDEQVSIHYMRRFADPEQNSGVKLVELEGADHYFEVSQPAGLGMVKLDRAATQRTLNKMADSIAAFIDTHLK